MSPRPPDALVYYLDANLDGPELVKTLRQAGVRCEAHRDHFPQDAADEDWMPDVAARGWVIVTRDFAVQRRPAERAAWTAANATIVMLRGDKLRGVDMAQLLLTAHAQDRLDNFIRKRIAPMVIYLAAPAQLTVCFGGERRGARKRS